jgi:hypothetical protein
LEWLEESATITPELIAELQEPVDRAMKGIRDLEAIPGLHAHGQLSMDPNRYEVSEPELFRGMRLS